jgi:hypothetical protein
LVAPSPDWFVGVSRLPLFEGGRWLDQGTIELVAWDAGTDSGATFTSPDAPSIAGMPIAKIVTPLSPGSAVVPLGTLAVSRLME